MRITTLKYVPPFFQGFVKDHRVRWACEEAGISYDVRLVDREQKSSEAYLAQQPFGQVPVLEDGNLILFESGAIVLHIAQKSEILLPKDPIEKSRATAWVFAALNSVEPSIQSFNQVADLHPKEEWTKARLPTVRAHLNDRLKGLSHWLKDKDYLENRFTVGDLVMSTVLRDLNGMGVLEEFPNLAKYHQRCEARPAFQKAIAAQMKSFTDNAPKQ